MTNAERAALHRLLDGYINAGLDITINGQATDTYHTDAAAAVGLAAFDRWCGVPDNTPSRNGVYAEHRDYVLITLMTGKRTGLRSLPQYVATAPGLTATRHGHDAGIQ